MLVKPMSMEEAVSMPFNKVTLHGGLVNSLTLDNLVGLYFYILPAVYLLTFALLAVSYIKKGLNITETRLLAVLLLATFSFKGVMVQSNVGHLLKVIPLGFMLAAYLAAIAWKADSGGTMIRGLGRAYAIMTAGAALVFVLIFVSTGYGKTFNAGSIGRRFADGSYITAPRGRVYVPERLDSVGPLIDYIQTNTSPDEPVLVITHDSMIGFLADRKNPTRYDFFIAGVLDGEEQRRTCADALKSRYIVYYEPPTFLGYPRGPALRFRNYCSDLYACLMPRYRYEAQFGPYLVLVRTPGENPDTLRLISGRDSFMYGNYDKAVEELGKIGSDSPAYGIARQIMGSYRSKATKKNGDKQ